MKGAFRRMKKAKGKYKVGYCKPPKHTRGKKGQSGNPAGKVSNIALAYRYYLDFKKTGKRKKPSIDVCLGLLEVVYPNGPDGPED